MHVWNAGPSQSSASTMALRSPGIDSLLRADVATAMKFGEVVTIDLSQIAAKFSPEGRAALSVMQDFIRSSVHLDVLDERALLLAGLPQEQIEEGMAEFSRELSEEFDVKGSPERWVVAFTVASAEIVRARIAEIQATGAGRA